MSESALNKINAWLFEDLLFIDWRTKLLLIGQGAEVGDSLRFRHMTQTAINWLQATLSPFISIPSLRNVYGSASCVLSKFLVAELNDVMYLSTVGLV